MNLTVTIAPSLTQPGSTEPAATHLGVGVVEISGVKVRPSDSTFQADRQQVLQAAAERFPTADWEQQAQAVRQLLRYGKFKASGRSRPAQEYLLKCLLTDGRLPSINAPVDLLNLVSLSRNLPISLLSVRKCSTNLRVDRGSAGESYVFNSVGQQLDLTDLITVYDLSQVPPRPVGTPVKDSLAGKIEEDDEHLVALIYFPRHFPPASEACQLAIRDLMKGMQLYCQADSVASMLLAD
jgi:DNA/RNA-binding domain of Phe-tRNA-synthetase-like protein